MTPPRVLIEEEAVQARVRELAAQISKDYGGAGRVTLVGILKGAYVLLADLARQLTVDSEIEFMAVSSYGNQTVSNGAVRVVMDVRENIAGKHVLVVEDIVDTGRTLHEILALLRAREPASLRVLTLVRKLARAEIDVPVDYLGFDIPDVWVVGYGLDHAERFRALPYIGVLDQP